MCSRCEATSSLMWSRSEDGSILCLGCHRAEKNAAKSASASSSSDSRTATPSRESASPGRGSTAGTQSRRTRMKERTAKARQAKGGGAAAADKSRGGGANGQPGGQTGGRGNHQAKGRRTLAKEQKLPEKAQKLQTTIVTSDAVFHKVLRNVFED